MYPFPEGTKPEDFPTKERFPHLKSSHFHDKNHFLLVDTVVGGTIPGNFMPAIEKGFLEKIATGVVAGYPVQNVCVEVYFGKDHPVDSNETAFRIAARQAFANMFKRSEAEPAGADREARTSRCRPTRWATSRAISRAAAARWSAWTRPAAA